MITRLVSEQDRAACCQLWLTRFADAPSFVDWFFQNRFSAAYSAGTFDGDRLVSMSLGYPMMLTSPHGDVPAVMLSGISTLPSHERQGLMHQTVRLQLQEAHRKHIPVAFNHPVNLHQYDSLGFRPITDTLYYESASFSGSINASSLCTPAFSDMHALYDRLCSGCWGCVRRSQEQFALKMQDYLSDQARFIGVTERGRLVGYCVCFVSEDALHAEEAVAAEGAYPLLLAALHRQANGRRVTAKLPPFLPFEGERRPQNVAAFTGETDAGDIQTFFGYPSVTRNCYAIDEY